MTTIEAVPVQSRMPNPALVLDGALPALQSVHKAVQRSGLPARTMELVNLRASQINGCGVCLVQHPLLAREAGETDERIFAVGAWREAPYYTAAERAALALTEHMTRIADTAEPVPDDVWEAAAA